MEKEKTVTCQHRQPKSCDSATGPRFRIKALMFWTSVTAGAIPIAMTGADYPPSGVFLVGVYLIVVCGIATLVGSPRSPDAWIPIGTASLLFVLLLTGVLVVPLGGCRDEFIHVLFLGGVPLGIFLLVRNVMRIKRTGFSLAVFVYHLGVWLGWMGITVGIMLAPIT